MIHRVKGGTADDYCFPFLRALSVNKTPVKQGSQSCTVAKIHKSWRITAESNLADCSVSHSALMRARKSKFVSFCWLFGQELGKYSFRFCILIVKLGILRDEANILTTSMTMTGPINAQINSCFGESQHLCTNKIKFHECIIRAHQYIHLINRYVDRYKWMSLASQ